MDGHMGDINMNKTNIQRKQTIFGSGFDLAGCINITEQDIYELAARIYKNDIEEFEAIMLTNKFHGHIGPNTILGAKMALRAKDLLDGSLHKIKVITEAGSVPPVSCLNDGIMCAIGASFGRGLISRKPEVQDLAATFSCNGKTVRLEVRPEIENQIKKRVEEIRQKQGGLTEAYYRDVRNVALNVWETCERAYIFNEEFSQ